MLNVKLVVRFFSSARAQAAVKLYDFKAAGGEAHYFGIDAVLTGICGYNIYIYIYI